MILPFPILHLKPHLVYTVVTTILVIPYEYTGSPFL